MKQVLIVEDEMNMRFFLMTLMKTAGFNPLGAKNGKEGIQLARNQRPDLILLDVMMPEQGGALTYREFRTTPEFKDVPVIILSGVAKNTFYHYLKMLNAQIHETIPLPDAYLEKPPEPERLLEVINSIIKQEQVD